MTCKKVTMNQSVCKIKAPNGKWTVFHTRKGRYGDYYIHDKEVGLSKKTADAVAKKLENRLKREAKKRRGRRTPYP